MSAVPVSSCLASTNASNKSPSKQMYSFGKSNRFADAKQMGCNKVSYDMPSSFVSRCATFGYGDRFGNKNYETEVPPPGSYNLPG